MNPEDFEFLSLDFDFEFLSLGFDFDFDAIFDFETDLDDFPDLCLLDIFMIIFFSSFYYFLIVETEQISINMRSTETQYDYVNIDCI